MQFPKAVTILFAVALFIDNASATSKNDVSLAPSSMTYVAAGMVYGRCPYERPFSPFLERYPRFARVSSRTMP